MTEKKPTKLDLEQAYERIKPQINHTPILQSGTINDRCQAEVFFKCENFQKVGAFKFRRASNAVLSLKADEISNGVATHSSGNHAQALSLAAKMRGIKARIVMPENSPKVKIDAVKSYGADITFCKPTLQAREETLADLIENTGATFVHPYNNYPIICGQSTAAIELFESLPGLDSVITPVGGGGLLSGSALAAHFFSPGTKVYAGEPKNADDAYQSLQKGEIIPVVNPDTIADGLKTSLGDKTFPIIKKYVEDIFTVEEEEIISAMRYIWERMKIIIEPSSAVPVAALFKNTQKFQGQKIGIIISGGNVDLNHMPW